MGKDSIPPGQDLGHAKLRGQEAVEKATKATQVVNELASRGNAIIREMLTDPRNDPSSR